MRLRGIKNQQEKIGKHPLVIDNPTDMKGQWQQYFNNDNPLWLEIGMGFGGFIAGMMHKYANVNFIGFEKYSKVVVRAIKRFNDEGINNVALVREDAVKLLDIFEEHEIDRLFLNFSDPWPKKRYAKRRLTYHTFLELYDKILKPNGEIHFKTDNIALFDFTVEEMTEHNWQVIFKTYDLHHSEQAADNVMTEYEQKFSEKGQTICKLIAKRNNVK